MKTLHFTLRVWRGSLARLVQLIRRFHPKFCWRCGGELVPKNLWPFSGMCVACDDCLHIPSQSYVDRHWRHFESQEEWTHDNY